MSATSLARRYERLLFFAGPLAFVSLLLLFVAFASDQQEDRRRAKCLRQAAEVVETNSAELAKAHAGKMAVIKGTDLLEGTSTDSYWLALSRVLIHLRVSDCGPYLDFLPVEPRRDIPEPSVLLGQIRKKASALETQPLSYYGVEVPEKATINMLGTPVQMNLVTLARVMQFALGPILLLWLGSLYNTRHRESLNVARMTDVKELYPHLINVYPVFAAPHGTRFDPRKRSWSFYVAKRFFVPTIFALIRIALLCVFVGPPVTFYLGSIYYLFDSGVYPYLFFGFGFLVGLFAMVNLVGECLPWHVTKRFSVVTPTAI